MKKQINLGKVIFYSILIELLLTIVTVTIKFEHFYFPPPWRDVVFFINIIGLTWVILIITFWLISKLIRSKPVT
jgi:hypothetical protein